MKWLLVLLALTPGVAYASDTITSWRDTMGYTHTKIQSEGKTTRCISQKTTMGQTITRCN